MEPRGGSTHSHLECVIRCRTGNRRLLASPRTTRQSRYTCLHRHHRQRSAVADNSERPQSCKSPNPDSDKVTPAPFAPAGAPVPSWIHHVKDRLVLQSHIPPAGGDTVPVVHGQPVRTQIAYPLPPGPASGQHLTGVVATGPAPARTLDGRRNSLSPCGWDIRLWRKRAVVRGINPRSS